jgi:hypothetical protein
MTFVPVMFSVWGALVLLVIVLKLYASRLGRDEDDQIMLSESTSSLRAEQAAIVAKVTKVQPLQRIALVLVGLMTLFVIGYYVLDIFNQFR